MAKIAANKPRKGEAASRVAISWGKYDIKVNGKAATVEGISRIQKGLFDRLGLAAAKAKPKVTVGKDKKGRQRLEGASTVIGSRFVEVSLGEWTETKVNGKTIRRTVWYRVRLPAYVSLASAYKVLKKGGKVDAIRWPNGKKYVVEEDAG